MTKPYKTPDVSTAKPPFARKEECERLHKNRIVSILMYRDDMPQDEAEEALRDAKERVADGDDPEEVLEDEFGLEPDYIEDLM